MINNFSAVIKMLKLLVKSRRFWILLVVVAVVVLIIISFINLRARKSASQVIINASINSTRANNKTEAVASPIPIQADNNTATGDGQLRVKISSNSTNLEFKNSLGTNFVIGETMQGASGNSVMNKLNESTAGYSDILPGVDASKQVFDTYVKETLIIKDQNAPTKFTYEFSVPQGLVLAKQAGLIYFFDRVTREPIVLIGQPIANDAAGKSFAFQYSLSGSILTMEPSQTLAGVQYPLKIDPSYYLISTGTIVGTGPKSIVRDSQGSYFSVYRNGSEIYLAKSVDGGFSWTESAVTSGSNSTQNSPSIIIDASDQIYLFWSDWRYGGTQPPVVRTAKLTTSSFGTRPSVSDLLSQSSGQPVRSPVSNAVIDSVGNIYLIIQGDNHGGGPANFSVIKYSGNTATYLNGLNTNPYGDLCMAAGDAHLAIDSTNNPMVVWTVTAGCTGPPPYPDVVYYAKYNGLAWTSPYTIENRSYNQPYSAPGEILADPVVDSNDNLYVAWFDFLDPIHDGHVGAEIRYRMKTAAGSWQSVNTIYSKYEQYSVAQRNFALAMDASDNIHMVWPESQVTPDGYNWNNVLKYMGRVSGSWISPRSLMSNSGILGDYSVGSFIWSKYPKIQDVSTNIPTASFGFTYLINQVDFKYYGGPTWPATPPPSPMQVTLAGDYYASSPTVIYGNYNSQINHVNSPPNFDYYLYCNRNDDSLDYTTVSPDATYLNHANNAISWGSNCRYSPGGTYYPKIIAKQGAVVKETHKQIVVQTLAESLETVPASGGTATSRRFKVTGTGTATGPFNYSIWYNCTRAGNNISDVIAFCGDPTRYGEVYNNQTAKIFTTSTAHNYGLAGTYSVKVIVSSPTGRFLPADASYSLVINTRDVVTVKSVAPSPSSGSAPLLPNLAINYETNHTYGYWDVHVYCSAASTRPDFIHLNIADANVGPASGKSSPWFSGTLNLASNCSYTGSGARQMTILMKASDDPLINGAANPVVNLTAVTYSLAVYATGPGSTANIRGVLTTSLPTGTNFRYTMYCDRNDSLNTITSPWQAQTTSTSRDLVLGSCNYAAPGQNYYPKIVVEYPNGTPVVSAKTVYNYTNPMTLAASISANPNPGVINRPVSLSATVTGSATGNINYSFYCKDTDASPAVSFTNVSNTSQNAPNACTYSAAGTFKPKVVVVRSGSTAQATASLSIGIPTVSVSLSAIPSTVTPGQSVSLSAQVAGTAEGNIIYDFYCLDTAATYDKRITSTSTNVSADNLCSYSSIGASRAKVVVSRESKTAQSTATVTVSSAGTNGQIIFEENGDPIKIRGSLVANSVVINARNKKNQTYSARIFSDKSILASRLPGFSDIMNIISSNQ